MSKTALIVSAHPGDFVWRAGGAIALHAKKGYRVKIVCLAFRRTRGVAVRMEQPGMTLDKVKGWAPGRGRARAGGARRRGSSSSMPADYPLRLTDAHMDR